MSRLSTKHLERLEKLAEQVQQQRQRVQPGKYAGRPVDYCREVLKVQPWAKQCELMEAIFKPPYKVLGKSSHSIGKTFVEACLVNFWFDTYNPGCVITTAPTYRDVCDLLWAQVRALRERVGLGGFSGARAPELYDSPEHYAKGFTASRGESFQGRHPERALFLFDEATGVDPVFWATARTMFQPTGMHAWLCMFNPTDTSSQAYAEELKVDLRGEPQWKTITISSPEHPNIQASLDGKPEPYPGAVSLAQFEDWLAAWSDAIDEREAKETDLEWPPGSGRWYRPGPLMEGRALGRYPSSATYGVWSDRAWKLATGLSDHEPDLSVLPEIGCDVARHGDDYTAIHVRWGHLSLHHERHNGWEYQQTAERLKELCGVYAEFINHKREKQARPVDPQEILVKVDSDAYGWGVIEQREGYQFVGLSGCSRPLRPYEYSNRRSELWFNSMKLAKAGELCVARLSQEVQHRLRQQLFAPQWQPVSGLMRVEDKAITKQRLGASPDDADAFNLAYAPAMGVQMAEGIDVPDRPRQDSRDRDPRPGTRGLFGR